MLTSVSCVCREWRAAALRAADRASVTPASLPGLAACEAGVLRALCVKGRSPGARALEREQVAAARRDAVARVAGGLRLLQVHHAGGVARLVAAPLPPGRPPLLRPGDACRPPVALALGPLAPALAVARQPSGPARAGRGDRPARVGLPAAARARRRRRRRRQRRRRRRRRRLPAAKACASRESRGRRPTAAGPPTSPCSSPWRRSPRWAPRCSRCRSGSPMRPPAKGWIPNAFGGTPADPQRGHARAAGRVGGCIARRAAPHARHAAPARGQVPQSCHGAAARGHDALGAHVPLRRRLQGRVDRPRCASSSASARCSCKISAARTGAPTCWRGTCGRSRRSKLLMLRPLPSASRHALRPACLVEAGHVRRWQHQLHRAAAEEPDVPLCVLRVAQRRMRKTRLRLCLAMEPKSSMSKMWTS